jgi:EmrB/QacA subfamily drug resistance transporter
MRNRPAIALTVIVGCQLILVVDGTIVNVALPDMQRDLHLTATSLSWVLNAYSLAFGSLLLLGGRFGDILGRRRMFTIGVGVFTVASLLGGLAPSGGLLFAARALQGVGAAIAAPSSLSLIATNFPEGEHRHRALAWFSAAAGGGGSLGIIAGGMLTQWASWRWVLFVNVPIGIAIVVLAPLYVKESQRHPGRIDVAGAVVSSLAMCAVVFGFIRAASNGWHDSVTVSIFAAAVVLIVAFIFIERRATVAIVPLRLFARRNRASAYANMLLLGAAMVGVFFYLSQFMQDDLGMDPLLTGLAFLVMTVPLFVVARLTPRFVRRFGPKIVTCAGTLLILVAMVWLTALSRSSQFVGALLGPLILVGVGIGLTFMPLNAIILAGVEPQDAGAASGVLQALQRIGQAVGLAVLVVIFATSYPNRHDPNAFAHGIDRAFLGTALLVAAALVVALFGIARPRSAR